MQPRSFKDDEVPYFCWGRQLTVGDIRAQLRHATGPDWVRLASWILREAAVADVWAFLNPQEVKDLLDDLAPFLDKRREFWHYLIGIT
ncbi:MAG TPA: hypothetical protein VFJ58_13105 [Armatimonadota bacterium]|nr:hypothetical protein [Armatimonadota bacterium]